MKLVAEAQVTVEDGQCPGSLEFGQGVESKQNVRTFATK